MTGPGSAAVPRWMLVVHYKTVVGLWVAAGSFAAAFVAASIGSSSSSDVAIVVADLFAIVAGAAIVRVLALHLRLRRVTPNTEERR